MKKILLLTLLISFVYSDTKIDAINYINSLRQNAGLTPLVYNSTLENSAQNHADYLENILTAYNIFDGHDESYSTEFFTGVDPTQRAYFVDYQSSFVSENLSSGQKDIYSSIDGLMSAIYHRFGFLDTKIDQIGIGINNSIDTNPIYNYNMGNSLLNNLCSGESFEDQGTYYQNICKNETIKIEASQYDNAMNNYTLQTPDYILWPNANGSDIPTSFYEESPDPLPNHSVSGYPISVEFNYAKFKDDNISLIDFNLYNESNDSIESIVVMDQNNDPNSKHTKFQYTFFPTNRLQSNHIYNVSFKYFLNDMQKEISWQFLTRKFPYPYYTIESNNQTVDLVSGKKYAIYFPPQFATDIFNSYSLSYNTSTAPQIELYDNNTIYITLNGTNEQYCNITLSNSGQNEKSLKLQLASSDLAMVDTLQQIDTTKTLPIQQGWNLISADLDLQTLSESINIVWQYDQNWSAYSNNPDIKDILENSSYATLSSVENTKGTWIYANKDLNLTINNSSDQYSYTYPLGWNLAGTNKDINVSEISCSQGNYYNSWRYINNEWKLNINSSQNYPYENFDSINSNEGFWVYCK